ncbi:MULTISPECIES: hypothetical protein [Streptosporangium]|uniref:Uncharacterized protein n=1 Tax=Streptosporangium brasiliense TaxID=47480 RepID=A0ABT9RM49_9ACTN|nr:hypothetical protein [Streptosporangium brasiliense]MDP9870373.1 hypothetical protein [Streptosporangium brasiliense]
MSDFETSEWAGIFPIADALVKHGWDVTITGNRSKCYLRGERGNWALELVDDVPVVEERLVDLAGGRYIKATGTYDMIRLAGKDSDRLAQIWEKRVKLGAAVVETGRAKGPWSVTYFRHHKVETEDDFATRAEALGRLWAGLDSGTLTPRSVIGPDGSVELAGNELDAAIEDYTKRLDLEAGE